MDPREIAIEVASDVYGAVRPHLGGVASGDIVGESKSGDFTFAIDEVAEARLPGAVADVEQRVGVRLAIYSEDKGLVSAHADPEYVLVVDPVDGTRPAICGLESCCVSVAVARLRSRRATFGDIVGACLIELKSGNVLSCGAGSGVYLRTARCQGDNRIDGTMLTGRSDLRQVYWAHEVCARPTEATQMILGPLVDMSSFRGGVFVFNSSSFAISRVVLGQLDAYLDPYATLLSGTQGDKWSTHCRELYEGKVFGLFPYDIAAAVAIAREAGATIFDARGNSLEEVDLLDSSENAVLSCVVASNRELGDRLRAYLASRFSTACD